MERKGPASAGAESLRRYDVTFRRLNETLENNDSTEPHVTMERKGPASAGAESLRRYDVTFRRLNETLENNDPTVTDVTMTLLLQRHQQNFIKLYDYFRGPDPKSQATIEKGDVPYRGKPLKLASNHKNFIIQISKQLNLDEVQCFTILQNYARTEVKGTSFTYDISRLDEIRTHYYDERISLCNCIATLLRNASNPEFAYRATFADCVHKLMASNLEQNVIKHLTTLSQAPVPSDLARDDQERWLTQNLLEQCALLEILFLMLYDRLEHTPERLLHLLRSVLKPMEFGYRHANSPQLNQSGRAAMRRLGYLCCLVGLLAINLEQYTEEAVSADLIQSKEIGPLDQLMRSLCMAPNAPSAPVLLSWSAVICRIVSSIGGSDDDFEWQAQAAVAVQYRAIPYLNELLSGFAPDDPNLRGYKSVVRGFLSVIMSAFSLETLSAEVKELIQLHTKVFVNIVPLCTVFWTVDIARESQVALLDQAQLSFPAEDFGSFLRMVSSLIADAATANYTFEYLKKRRGVRQTISQARLAQFADEIPGQQICVVRQGTKQLVPFMYLQPGTRGTIITPDGNDLDRNNPVVTVVWQISYSVWHVVLELLDTFIEALRTQILPREELSSLTENVSDGLFLIASLFEGARGDLTEPLVNHLAEVSDPTYWASPLLPRVLLILQGAALLKPAPVGLLTSAMKCLHGISHTQPVQVWREMQRTTLIDASEVRGWATSSGTIRQLLTAVECAQGRYPITVAFLELLQTILSYLQGWKNPTGSPAEHAYPDEFGPFLLYVQTCIFTFYSSWRYNSIVEEWSIGYTCLRLFEQILADPVCESSHNAAIRQHLLHSILHETGIIQVLLNIIGMGPAELERLRRRAKEGRRVELLVLAAFNVLERVLVLKQYLPDGSKATPLELMLLTRQQGRDSVNLVYIIASYVRYHFSVQVALMATKILTLLCGTVVDGERPPSLVGYLGSKASEIRHEFLWKLSDSREVVTLRVAIIRFVRQALRYQPGLAELFLKDPPQSSEDERNKKLHEDDNSAPLLDASDNVATNCVKVVMGIIFKKEYIEQKPLLVSEALNFLFALWNEAPDQHTVLETVTKGQQSNPDFWGSVVSSLDAAEQRDRGNLEAIHVGSYTTLSRAYVMRILALEVFHTKASMPLAKGLQAPLETIKANQIKWFERFTQSSFNDEDMKMLETISKEMNFDFSGMQIPDHDKVYGSNFLYDINAVRQRVTYATPRADAGQMERFTDLFHLAKKVNTQAARVEAELEATRAWVMFTKVATLRQMTDGGGNLMGLITSMLKRLAKESRQALPVHTLDLELTSLLLLLVRRWTSLQPVEGDAATVDVLNYLRSTFLRVHASINSMEVEYGTLAHRSVGVRAKMDPIPILSNLLGCFIYVLKNLKSWSASVREITASLLPSVLQCCEEEKLVTAALAVAELICQQATEEISAVLSVLEDRDTIGRTVQQFGGCLRERSNVQTADALLHFFLAIAQSGPATCELLAVAGFTRAVCSETYVDDVANNLPLYLDNTERNPWHRIWCLSLALLTKMLQSLKHRENFVDQTLEFVAAHQVRLDRALDLFSETPQTKDAKATTSAPIPNQFMLTVAKVEETDAAAALLNQLVNHRRRWRPILDSPYSDTSNVLRIESNVLSLLHQSAEPLVRDVATAIKPVSPQERKLWDQQQNSRKDQTSNNKAATKPSPEASLTFKVENHLFQIVRSCLSFIWLLTPRVFAEDEDPETLVPIFSIDQQPQISLLTRLATAASQRLTKSDVPFSTPEASEILLNVVEICSAIVLAHLTMFMSPQYDEGIRRRSRDQCAPDLDTVISTVLKSKKNSPFLASCQAWIKKMGKFQF
eukprot:TRINITY_DN7965_c0_g1_i1.p1 TRINITY_DN7965_c0_g1~~TRINITY_DN7965_c0_g1_i1.p1  ORF type:complete len:1863 (+),score=301.46 TRINITY_DN7965_c0_g1_i1:45-5591(+)